MHRLLFELIDFHNTCGIQQLSKYVEKYFRIYIFSPKKVGEKGEADKQSN